MLMVISCRLPHRHLPVKPRPRRGVNCPQAHIADPRMFVPSAFSGQPISWRDPVRFITFRHERQGDQPRVHGGGIGLADGAIQPSPIQHRIRPGHNQEAIRHAHRSAPNRILRLVGASCGCLHLRMTEQTPDHRKALPPAPTPGRRTSAGHSEFGTIAIPSAQSRSMPQSRPTGTLWEAPKTWGSSGHLDFLIRVCRIERVDSGTGRNDTLSVLPLPHVACTGDCLHI